MTDQPEDPPEPLDLSAWQPPAPPPNLADAVIVRAHAAEVTVRTRGLASRGVMVMAIAALVASSLALFGELVLQSRHALAGTPATAEDVAYLTNRVDAQSERIDMLSKRIDQLEHDHIAADNPPAPVKSPEPQPSPSRPTPPTPATPFHAVADTGTLEATCNPTANVLVDNVAVGRTPYAGALATGSHRVTFEIGLDKYSFKINVKKGETTVLAKDFTPNPY